MKRLIIFSLAILICLPTAFARRKKKKSGVIENNVYTDAKYDFKLTLLENWDRELQKPDSDFRIVLNQKEHEIPPDLMQFPQLAEVPELKVFSCKQTMDPKVFIDSLVSPTYSTDTKKELFKDLVALKEKVEFTGFKTTQRMSIKIDDKKAAKWEGTTNYINDLGMGETIPRTYAFGIVCVQNGEEMLIFTLSTEQMFFQEVLKEAMTMIESLKWEG